MALSAVGCAGGYGTVASTTTVEKCNGAKPAVVARKVRRLNQEIARMRVLAAKIPNKTVNGTPELSEVLDRFLAGIRDRDVPAFTRSRLVDHAAAIVAPVCEQCFQALEANRPTGGGANLGCG